MTTTVDDDLWSAIGDPTRRRLLDLLLDQGSATATSLSEHLPVTRQAVAKHLTVLDRAGLVHSHSAGREKQFRVDEPSSPAPSPSSPESATPGTPDSAASSTSPKPSRETGKT